MKDIRERVKEEIFTNITEQRASLNIGPGRRPYVIPG